MNVALASSSAALRRSAARSAFRRPNGTRFNSTSTEKKAQDALAGAQKTAVKGWEKLVQFLGPAGQKLGNLLGGVCFHPCDFKRLLTFWVLVVGYKEPLVYNFTVAREVVKRIYVSEALSPPAFSQYAEVYRQIWSNVIHASYWRGLTQNGQFAQVGIYGLQAYGIFKVCTRLVMISISSSLHYQIDWRDHWSEAACWLPGNYEPALMRPTCR